MMAPPYPFDTWNRTRPGVTGGTDGFVIALLGDDDDFITGIQLAEHLFEPGKQDGQVGTLVPRRYEHREFVWHPSAITADTAHSRQRGKL